MFKAKWVTIFIEGVFVDAIIIAIEYDIVKEFCTYTISSTISWKWQWKETFFSIIWSKKSKKNILNKNFGVKRAKSTFLQLKCNTF